MKTAIQSKEHTARKSLMDGVPDWSREIPVNGEWKPGLFLLKALRDYHNAKNPIQKKWAVLRHRLWSAVSSAEIPLNSRIEGGLLIPHPTGIVVHHDAHIGPNVLLFQNCTIGSGGPKDGAPKIGANAIIGAGAHVLGGITIGRDAKVGANAVVLHDVPDGATAVGAPAKNITGK